MDDRRVFIDDPGFLAGNAAGLLRAQRAPVKAALRADDADLPVAALADAMGARELDRALSRFRARREQEDLVQPFRRNLDELFDQRRRVPRWETHSCAAGRC